MRGVSPDSTLGEMSGPGLPPVLNSESSEAEPEGKAQCELEDVLASSTFKRAPTLSKLLSYLWKRRNGEVSEYAIATEALGRKADFEPRVDATVRVLVSRLRIRLKEFYESDGAELATRIVIPVGSHLVQVVEVPKPTAEDVPDPELLPVALKRVARSRKLILAQTIAIGILILTCIGACS